MINPGRYPDSLRAQSAPEYVAMPPPENIPGSAGPAMMMTVT
jgi:hypothetical protein